MASKRGAEILPLGVGRELDRAGREDSHPIPEFDIPDRFERNESMCEPDRTEIGLVNDDWTWFIELHSVRPLATISGPYYAELLEGDGETFETVCRKRVTGILPGQLHFTVQALAAEVDG